MTFEATAVATGYSDIEEALTELFDAKSILSSMASSSEAIAKITDKIDRACYLLDRPWPAAS